MQKRGAKKSIENNKPSTFGPQVQNNIADSDE